jgi:hypothetical protein
MCAHGSQVKTQTPTQWKLNGRRMIAPPAYQPAVLFRHLRLPAISFPHEKLYAPFKYDIISIYFSFFFNSGKSEIDAR